MNYLSFKTPVGFITLYEQHRKLIALKFIRTGIIYTSSDLLLECKRQVLEYFAKEREIFDCPLLINGTDFQRKVWDLLLHIPFGQVRSYYDLAVALGNKNFVRAVANANRVNPLPILIPCHRVIGKNYYLKGYSSGVYIKKFLLEHEGHKIVNNRLII